MTDLHFTPCQADPDVWMQPAVKPDRTKYYEYVLIYVNDILVISHRASTIMNNLSALYCLKENPSNEKKGMLHQIIIWVQTLVCTHYREIPVASRNGTCVQMTMKPMPLRMLKVSQVG